MDEALQEKMGGREILVVAIEDTPAHGQATTVLAVTRSVPTTVNVEGAGAIETKAFVFSREEAAQFAQHITATLAQAGPAVPGGAGNRKKG